MSSLIGVLTGTSGEGNENDCSSPLRATPPGVELADSTTRCVVFAMPSPRFGCDFLILNGSTVMGAGGGLGSAFFGGGGVGDLIATPYRVALTIRSCSKNSLKISILSTSESAASSSRTMAMKRRMLEI